jgi:hypothetical protein
MEITQYSKVRAVALCITAGRVRSKRVLEAMRGVYADPTLDLYVAYRQVKLVSSLQ